jgi:hypothetical protein
MKIKILFPFVALFIVAACNSNDPKARARKSIEANILPRLNDPKSYEFVSIDLSTFLTKTDSIKAAGSLLLNINSGIPAEEKVNIYITELKRQMEEEKTKKITETEKQYVDSLKTVATSAVQEWRKQYILAVTPQTDSDIIAYTATINYRAKNQLGAMTLGSNTFTLDRNFDLVAGIHLDSIKTLSEQWGPSK